jgi:putative phosphoribosyl transferase
MVFRDRTEAGRVLAGRLTPYAHRRDTVVLGLPRGGVPVAHEVATRLGLPLDVFVVRKLGVPGHEELAMGAIASGGVLVVNEEVVEALGIPAAALESVAAEEERELARRERAYRDGRLPHPLRGRTAILVDDGLATGSTMRAAVAALRQSDPARIVVAAPVGSAATCSELGALPGVTEVICSVTPEPFFGVGAWYRDFSQTTDEEVRRLLGAPGEAGVEARAP